MAAYSFEDIKEHIGHEIECAGYYGDDNNPQNVAVECITCGMVLFDLDQDEYYEKCDTE